MSQNISPASRDHAAAEVALKANAEAVATLKAQRVQLLEDEATARRALDSGAVSPEILSAITSNVSQAAALVPAIESLEADRPALVRAVSQAGGEQWAEKVRALVPEGTYAAMQGIRDELAGQIREAVATARTRAEVLAFEAGRLEDEAARLARAGVLPRGASYSSTSGLTFDGVRYGWAPTDSLAEKVGAQLDSEHRQQKHAEALLRSAEDRQANEAERAAVQAELDAARAATLSAPAPR